MANKHTLPILMALAAAMAPEAAEAQTATSTVPKVYKPRFELIPGYSFAQINHASEEENPASRTQTHSPNLELNLALGEAKDHMLTLTGRGEFADRKDLNGTKSFASASGSATYQPPEIGGLSPTLYLAAYQRDPLILAAQGRGVITINPGLELKFNLGDNIYIAAGGDIVVDVEPIELSRYRVSGAVAKEFIPSILSGYIGGAFGIDVHQKEVGTMNVGFAWQTPDGIELLVDGTFIKENGAKVGLAFPLTKGIRMHLKANYSKHGKDHGFGGEAGLGLARF